LITSEACNNERDAGRTNGRDPTSSERDQCTTGPSLRAVASRIQRLIRDRRSSSRGARRIRIEDRIARDRACISLVARDERAQLLGTHARTCKGICAHPCTRQLRCADARKRCRRSPVWDPRTLTCHRLRRRRSRGECELRRWCRLPARFGTR